MSHNCQKSLHWLYVCGENPLPHSETFVIPVQLYQENNLLRQKQEKSIINTQIFQGSRLGKVLDPFFPLLILHKKWSFSLKIPSVNVAKSTEICGFGKIYSRNCFGKFYFLCSVKCWYLGKQKRNTYRSNIKELTKEYMNQIEISFSLFE